MSQVPAKHAAHEQRRQPALNNYRSVPSESFSRPGAAPTPSNEADQSTAQKQPDAAVPRLGTGSQHQAKGAEPRRNGGRRWLGRDNAERGD